MLRWLQQLLQIAVVALLLLALFLLFWNLSSALLKVPPRTQVSAARPPAVTEPAQQTTPAPATAQPRPAPSSPVPSPVPSPLPTPAAPTPAAPTPAPVPAAVASAAPITAPATSGTAPGPAPFFAPPPVLSAYFYGAGSSLFFNPKKDPGRISIQFTSNPKVPLTVAGFELDYAGSLQIGSSVLEVWPVPQKQIIGNSSGATGKYSWTAQKPFIVGDGAVSYTITFQATGRGRMQLNAARLIYLENGQPRTLQSLLTGAVLWAQESFDDQLKAASGDLFWSRFSVQSRLGSDLYLIQQQGSNEQFVLHYTLTPVNTGDTLALRAIWTGGRIGGLPELDATGPDGYLRVLSPP